MIVEPNADSRMVAATLFQFYTANIQEGFTPDQAMQIVLALATMPSAGGAK